MSESEDALSRLQAAYGSPDAASVPLNTRFRKALRVHATAQRLQFSQDTAGNIYIARLGRDPELAPIAIAFPLDGIFSKTSFTSAFRVFSILTNENLPCDLALVGWTSLSSQLVGRDVWEASLTKNKRDVPEIEQFSSLSKPEDFSLSAIFEISEENSQSLRVSGSLVLVEKVKKHASVPVDIEMSTRKPTRAPEVFISGVDAESVACLTIRDYSAYISALFENFD